MPASARCLPLVVLTALLFPGCSSHKSKEQFSQIAEEFVYKSLSYSPVAATQVGYHRHGDVDLDSKIDDYSPVTLDKQRQWLLDVRRRLQQSLDEKSLSPDEAADLDIIHDQISLSLLELQSIQSYRHNPTLYVELVGNALYSPFVLEYTDKGKRFGHIINRLRALPNLIHDAHANLASAPDLWTKVAIEENEGNIALIDKTLREAVPQGQRAAYDAAAKPAIDALREFNEFLARELSKKNYDWRLGPDKYAQKFRYVIATDQTPDQVLASAEEEMKNVRQSMANIAQQLGYKSIKQALDAIATKHGAPDTYFADARRDLEETRQFVKEKNLLTLPPRDNLQVIETPEFMRGIYSVGGFNAAPALEPQLGAFYWITPIPPAWPKERIESKLREYNTYGLKLLTIHEAMPGHYVQLEYSNDLQPKLRRVLRSVYGSGVYVEGWAVYATEMMLDAGYLDNSQELRLTFLKQQLRVLANTILDVRLQTKGMTDQQALDLMINQAFQEREEAEGKLRRAKLSSTQLPTYFVGYRDWMRLRKRYQAEKGDASKLKDFHEAALKAGAVPLPVLSRLLLGKSL